MLDTSMMDLISGFNTKKILLELPSHLWHKISKDVLDIVKKAEWKSFKFFDGVQRSSEIKRINNKSGGIYLFYISPEVIPQNHRIVMYIGRARYTNNQNLRKRITEYYGYVAPNYDRPKITTMFQQWSEDVYCSYLELDCSNETIDLIEKELINKLLPYCNDAIPDKKIQKAVKAAGLQ